MLLPDSQVFANVQRMGCNSTGLNWSQLYSQMLYNVFFQNLLQLKIVTICKCFPPGVQPGKKKKKKNVTPAGTVVKLGNKATEYMRKGRGQNGETSSQNRRYHLNSCSLGVQRQLYAVCNIQEEENAKERVNETSSLTKCRPYISLRHRRENRPTYFLFLYLLLGCSLILSYLNSWYFHLGTVSIPGQLSA